MKTYIKKILIFTLILFFGLSSKVLAAAEITSRTNITIDGKQIYKLYNNSVAGTENYVGAEAAIIKVTKDGKVYTAYCIDFGVYVATGAVNEPKNLIEYFKNVLSEQEATELVKKLTQYIKFGYGSAGKEDIKYYLATQQLIWEAISDTGFYASDFYYQQAEGTLNKIRLDNFRWTNDENTKTVVDLSSEIEAIQSSIRNYYVTPSFCSSQSNIEIEVGETAEYTDNNNVLSSYNVTCEEGLKCEISGNKLKVTAIEDAGTREITFNKNISGTENYVYKIGNNQGVIINEGTLEPVSCQFGVDTFKNVQTSDSKILYIITIGLFCGVMAYIAYYTKKSLDGLK